VPVEFFQKTTADEKSTTVSAGVKVNTGNNLDKAKGEVGAELYYNNQTTGVGAGKSVGVKVSADATIVTNKIKVISTPVVQVNVTSQQKFGGSFYFKWVFN
jgi:hypothetical protein